MFPSLTYISIYSETSKRNQLFAFIFFDNFIGDVFRNFFIVVKHHRERSASLRVRTERCRITEHFSQRHHRPDDLGVAARFHPLDAAATGRDVAHDVTEVLFRDDDFDFHDRFQKNRIALRRGVFQCQGSSDFECHFARVDIVVRSVKQFRFNVDNRIAG